MNVEQDHDWKEAIRREIDQLRVNITEANHDIDKANVILVDAQVRLASLESKNPVSRDEFDPVKRLVWGFVGLVLVAVLTAVLTIVVGKVGIHP